MKVQLATLGIIAAVGFAAACDPVNSNTTANRAVTNGNTAAVVVNSNTSVNTNAGATTQTNAANADNHATAINFNGTRDEINKQSKEIAAEAKRLGGSVGAGASDAWIWTKTRTALLAANDLRDSTINVDVSDAAITLKGTVANKEQKAAAVKIANAIEGKKSVKDELIVKANDNAQPNATTNSNVAPIKKS